jgi:endogenous inhibitor of DNA gyrase (YacG/DUF329 family)
MRGGSCPPTGSTIRRTQSPWCGPRLQALDLSETEVGAEAAEELFRAKRPRALERLPLKGYYSTAETVRPFCSAGFDERTARNPFQN